MLQDYIKTYFDAGRAGERRGAGPDLAARALALAPAGVSHTSRRARLASDARHMATGPAARRARARRRQPLHSLTLTALRVITRCGGGGAMALAGLSPGWRLPPSWPRLSSILFAPACPHILTCLATQATLSRLSLTLIVRRHGLSSSNWAHASLSALLRFRSFSHQDSRCSSKGAVGKGRRQVAPSRCTPTAPVAWRRSKQPRHARDRGLARPVSP